MPTAMPPATTLLPGLLKCTTDDVIPITREGVERGSKIFGSAILRKSDLSLVVAASNDEAVSPLLHGETHALKKFWALPADQRPDVKECVFYATHEPCSLCLSGITWSGFDNITFMFTYEDTRDMFAIPHDIRILEEVFRVRAPGETDAQLAQRPLYNRQNAYWTAKSFDDLIEEYPGPHRDTMRQEVKRVKAMYDELSEMYQKDKGGKGIPLA